MYLGIGLCLFGTLVFACGCIMYRWADSPRIFRFGYFFQAGGTIPLIIGALLIIFNKIFH